jgi:hypothetical protein
MSKETNNVLKEDSELSGNLSLSGSYGPLVQFSANAAASTKTSKEEATTAACKTISSHQIVHLMLTHDYEKLHMRRM